MWDTIVVNPMINALVLLYDFLGNNFFLAIAVFTLTIRLITLPLNLRQQRSSLKMQEMQPQIQAIQKKYKEEPKKMQAEFAKIGYNPAESLLGCLPLLLQMPILFSLYTAIRLLLASSPLSMFELVQRLYPFVDLQALFPIANQFLWLNLGQPDPFFILPALVFATTFLQQRLLMPRKKDDGKKKEKKDESPMAGISQSMQITMPVMFGFMALTFPSGLSLYFILSNLIGVGQGLFIRRNMPRPGESKVKSPPPSSADKKIAKAEAAAVSSDNQADAKKEAAPATGELVTSGAAAATVAAAASGSTTSAPKATKKSKRKRKRRAKKKRRY